jgi:hypothetical protein
MAGERRFRFFLSNPDSGEAAAYCGDLSDRAALVKSLGEMVLSEIEADFGGRDPVDYFTLKVDRVRMTDDEVAALPDM